jgi:hypothetical protein
MFSAIFLAWVVKLFFHENTQEKSRVKSISTIIYLKKLFTTHCADFSCGLQGYSKLGKK